MKFLAIIFLSISTLTSCSIAKPLNDTLVTAEQLAYYYDGDIASLIKTVEMTDVEANVVANSIQTAARIRSRFESYRNKPSLVPSDLLIVEREYARLKNAYVAIRTIAINHQTEYRPEVWSTFELFDDFAAKLDIQFNELMAASRTNEAVVNTITLANSIIRVAALL